jgi:putative colanic acid biosynthesis UDP-glucose lipid carrier transferase
MNNTNRGLLRPYSAGFSFLVRLSDAIIIWYSLYGLMWVFNVYASMLYQYAALLTIIFYLLTAELSSTFRSSRLQNYGDIAGKVIFAWVLTSIALFLTAFITKTSGEFSRLAISTWLIITPALLTIERIFIFVALRRLRANISNTRSYAILGCGTSAHSLPKQIEELSWTGLQLAGKYDDLETLMAELERKPIDYIFLNYAGDEQEKIAAAIKALADSTASTYLVPDLLLSELLGSRWIMLGNTPLVVINDHPFYGGAWVLKKIEDLVLGSVLLVLSLPLMLIIALAIKMNSPGPILFRQRRHGLNGEVIKVLKFRTMSTQEDGSIVVQATSDDERVTSVGKFLRRTSLDELPQFFNVLEGSMSIVGPRPHALAHNDYYRQLIDGYMQRHKVKPGITGWAQVNGFRGETDTIDKMQARVDYDLYYINHWSVGLDLKILLLTIIEVVNGKKAY